jgi:phytoene dehydrogenase-like protein
VFQAARRYLEARHGSVELGSRVERVLIAGCRATGVQLADSRTMEADAVIVAVPPDSLAELTSGVAELGPVVGAAQRLEWASIVNAHLTFDRRVLEDAFAVGIDSPIQAIFRLADARTDDASARHPFVLSQSSASEWIDQTDEQIVAELSSALRELLPAARDAELVDSLVLRHRHATFVPAPGSHELRPKSRTPIPGLYLAGDWTATGWPSTIESAVLSGIYAAAALESDAATCSNLESGIEKGKSEA